MTPKELERIRLSGFLISIIHGRLGLIIYTLLLNKNVEIIGHQCFFFNVRNDIIAQVNHARSLAEKLQPVARMVELHGAHLVSHERPDEV